MGYNKGEENEIVIVYAFSGELYEKLTFISMTSILMNNIDAVLHFILLVDDGYRDVDGIFEKLYSAENCKIEFVYTDKSLFENAELHISHINLATYYRLRLPEILPELNKCIYLDCDTIVTGDISELFDIDLNGNWIAGVLGPGYINNPKSEEYCKTLEIPDLSSYVNAGVLVFDLKLMRENEISSEFMNYVSCEFHSQDQDIINKVCYGKILLLDAKFNVMTKYAKWTLDDYGEHFDSEMLTYAWNYPTIIHYADKVKPWNEPDSYFASQWWEVCNKTPFYDEFIYHVGQYHIYESLYNSEELIDEKIKKKVPELYALQGKKIALYGAGNFAKAFIQIYKEKGIKPEYIVVTKKDKSITDIDGIEVKALSEIPYKNKEITLVLAINSIYQRQVMDDLKKYYFKEILPLTDKLLRYV